jgi:endonuclease-3
MNVVTEGLYKQYPDLDSFLSLSMDEMENKIRKIGLYKNKSKNIYSMCRVLKEKFGGQVPKNMEDLMSLPGVGRKTASVVLVEAFDIPAFPVDTHVFRVTKRIGIAAGNTPDKVSDEVMGKLSEDKYHLMHHLLITHGRRTCTAKNPSCGSCILKDICNYLREESKKL